MKNLKVKSNNKGITLVALVITIIVLIILAGVSISILLGDNGLIQKAKQAAEKTDKAVQKEQQDLQILLNELDGELPTTVAKAIEKGWISSKNTTIEDEYENKIVIPAGFHIVMPSEDSSVVYDYTGNGTPSVQDGIVIEDVDGNQFVWIPVGTINNKEEDENGPTTTITLGRYSFASGTGTPSEYTSTDYIEETPEEHTSNRYTNTIANNITDFVTSTNANKGYYIARYEASYRDGVKPYSIKSEGTPADKTAAPSSYNAKQLWNWITPTDAANAAKAMYTNREFTSDLVNGYAWDTAIVFIQKYSGDTDYSLQTALNYDSTKTSPDNTGERTVGNDKVCNIYDMASNCREWSTETYMSTINCCVRRGGIYDKSNFYTSNRGNGPTSESSYFMSFRVTLQILLNEPPTTVEKAIKKGWISSKNTTIEDEYKNKIVIPAGFHIAMPTTENGIVYDYTGNGTPSVQDGIVIEDIDGNQFVWIPVGTINNKENDKNGPTTTIELGRYTFANGTGTPSEFTNTNYIEETPEQHATSGYTNTIATNITDFITSANTNKGYYLARYEASYRDGTRPYSIKSEGIPSDRNSYIAKKLWNYATQQEAASASKKMYTSTEFTSDLTNSYAWDTALVFIQKYSENKVYSKQTVLNYASEKTSPDNTGERTDTTDKVCNIYDMASNCREWSTETYTYDDSDPGVLMGGWYSVSTVYSSTRCYDMQPNVKYVNVSFRVTLYI